MKLRYRFAAFILLLFTAFLCVRCGEDKEYMGEGMPPLGVKAYTQTQGEYYTYNSLFYDVRARDAVELRTVVLTGKEVEDRLAAGETYTDIGKEGAAVEGDDLVRANTLDGLEGVVSPGKDPIAAYVVIAYARFADGTTDAVSKKVTTKGDPKELFEKLLGDWMAKMTVKENDKSVQKEFEVEIAAGVDDATEQEYRAKNRLVCKGFTGFTYYSPADLMANKNDIDVNGKWRNNPEQAAKDYGPKWFIEIAKDGTVTVPVAYKSGLPQNLVPSLLGYLPGGDHTLTGVEGTAIHDGTPFTVDISTDMNTITVNYLAQGTVRIYPYVLVWGSSGASVAIRGASSITLTRLLK